MECLNCEKVKVQHLKYQVLSADKTQTKKEGFFGGGKTTKQILKILVSLSWP